ncbi:helix-turn-helix domain-containing protein [Streptomyces decoyicus]|uniref:helix-turn-helix domain-containing protein n=1 Tax=Streptomyces decoyicus TaxID=249567 RepID=UPI0036296984
MTTDSREIRHHVPVTRQRLTTWDADRFKRTYRAKGLTLEQIAIKAGIPYSAVRSYSAGGARPTPERLGALADAIGVETTDLAPLRPSPTLHELRWHSRMTVEQLAAKVGYSVSHTRLVLSGVAPVTEPARWTRALATTEQKLQRAWSSARAESERGTVSHQ